MGSRSDSNRQGSPRWTVDAAQGSAFCSIVVTLVLYTSATDREAVAGGVVQAPSTDRTGRDLELKDRRGWKCESGSRDETDKSPGPKAWCSLTSTTLGRGGLRIPAGDPVRHLCRPCGVVVVVVVVEKKRGRGRAPRRVGSLATSRLLLLLLLLSSSQSGGDGDGDGDADRAALVAVAVAAWTTAKTGEQSLSVHRPKDRDRDRDRGQRPSVPNSRLRSTLHDGLWGAAPIRGRLYVAGVRPSSGPRLSHHASSYDGRSPPRPEIGCAASTSTGLCDTPDLRPARPPQSSSFARWLVWCDLSLPLPPHPPPPLRRA